MKEGLPQQASLLNEVKSVGGVRDALEGGNFELESWTRSFAGKSTIFLNVKSRNQDSSIFK